MNLIFHISEDGSEMKKDVQFSFLSPPGKLFADKMGLTVAKKELIPFPVYRFLNLIVYSLGNNLNYIYITYISFFKTTGVCEA